MFKANFTYEAEKEPLDLDESNVMGIDLGVNNFATIVTTEGTPYIVDGRKLKNQILYQCRCKCCCQYLYENISMNSILNDCVSGFRLVQLK